MTASQNLATLARRRFATRKRKLLAAVAMERRTPTEVPAMLERLYVRQTREYLRVPPTKYRDWLALGPRPELEELRHAHRDDALWDRLLDRAVLP